VAAINFETNLLVHVLAKGVINAGQLPHAHESIDALVLQLRLELLGVFLTSIMKGWNKTKFYLRYIIC